MKEELAVTTERLEARRFRALQQDWSSVSRPMQKWAEMDLTTLVKRTPKNESSMNAAGKAPGSGDPNAG